MLAILIVCGAAMAHAITVSVIDMRAYTPATDSPLMLATFAASGVLVFGQTLILHSIACRAGKPRGGP